MTRFFSLAVLLLLTLDVDADEYYRSLDGTGKVHYGDAPLSDAADFEKIKPLSELAPDEHLPFVTRRAKEKFPVTLYVADNCGEACEQAHTYLNKRGIPYTEIYLGTNEEIETFKKASGGETVPTLNVGKNWLKGFLESQWGAELDSAGYPKTAPYGLRRHTKSAPPNKSE